MEYAVILQNGTGKSHEEAKDLNAALTEAKRAALDNAGTGCIYGVYQLICTIKAEPTICIITDED